MFGEEVFVATEKDLTQLTRAGDGREFDSGLATFNDADLCPAKSQTAPC